MLCKYMYIDIHVQEVTKWTYYCFFELVPLGGCIYAVTDTTVSLSCNAGFNYIAISPLFEGGQYIYILHI